MWRVVIPVLAVAVLAAACTAPTLTMTPTLLPVQVEVTAEATPLSGAQATATPSLVPPSPTVAPTGTPTLAPSPTEAPASPTPTHPPVATTAAPAPAPTITPTVAASATPTTTGLLPAGVTAQDVAAAEVHTVDLINAQRAAQKLPPLAQDPTLMSIARARVADMVTRHYTGHYDPVTGVGLGKEMMTAAGYTSGFKAENWYGLAEAGPTQAAEVAMQWFMGDPPHAANILSPNFVGVGVGLAFNGKEWLIVQDFVGKNQ
jgi:uncharacterized protein YkwD